MRTAKVEELLREIEALEGEIPNGALAFDGDGTLWSGDVGEDFFAALLAGGELSPLVRASLVHEAEAQQLPIHGGPVEIAHRIHAAYLAGTFPEERVCEIMTWACAGWTRAELDGFAARVLGTLGLEQRLHGEALAVVSWAHGRGLPVFLVSASPRAIVEQAARVVGIELGRVTAATERVGEGGVVEPSVERPIPYGDGKVTRLREKLEGRALLAAFGDNAFDVPMLRAARIGVAIRPKERLAARAGEVPGLRVLERL